MTADDLYLYMKNPTRLSDKILPELKQLVDDFPYFHAAVMLYLKTLSVLEDVRFEQELKRLAVAIPDRKQLFLLIEGENYGIKMQEEDRSDAKDDAFALIDTFLAKRNWDDPSSEGQLLIEPSVSTDYLYWSRKQGEITESSEQEARLKHQDLIDSFIEQEETRQPGSLLVPEDSTSQPEISGPASVRELDDDYKQPLDESLFTETLARIYVKQQRYDKALQIIRKLSLNYPEKNVYFADQIRFLEKLIINTKK